MAEKIDDGMILQRLHGMINAKDHWLAEHASGREKRADWEIALYRLDAAVLREVYKRLAPP